MLFRSEKRDALRESHDHWRRACLLEPRGNDVLVGALYCEPVTPGATCGVIFFNNTGYLGMCGHGTIGLVASLHHLGMIQPGDHRIDTTVGPVSATLHEDGAVTVRNVPAYRYRQRVPVEVPGYGVVHGDIAWRSEEHTAELQSQPDSVCRLLPEKKKARYLPVASVSLFA